MAWLFGKKTLYVEMSCDYPNRKAAMNKTILITGGGRGIGAAAACAVHADVAQEGEVGRMFAEVDARSTR
jgi:hypothetical protein